MQVSVRFAHHTFHYRLTLEADDLAVGHRTFVGANESIVTLVGRDYQVAVPAVFSHIHPDLHAVAIWYAIRPFVGRSLKLPFGVSVELAETMAVQFGVTFENVDTALQPRRRPTPSQTCLTFSGGLDSTAARLILPRDVPVFLLDRIPRVDPTEPRDADAVIDMVEARSLARTLQRDGYPIYIVHEDHESLMRPYPTWHSEMSLLAVLYLADTFGIGTWESGDVLDVYAWGGYHDGQVTEWRFRRNIQSFCTEPETSRGTAAAPSSGFSAIGRLGITRSSCCGGLSEMGTAAIVHASPYRGKTASCYFHTAPSQAYGCYCLKCDKCFRKLLLALILEDREVPSALIDGFLGHGHIREQFKAPYLSWHHCWFYIFQKIRCRHPFIHALQSQAQAGPDLGLLAQWYPPAAQQMDPGHRDTTVAAILTFVERMNPADIERLHGLCLPPLRAPGFSAAAAPIHHP